MSTITVKLPHVTSAVAEAAIRAVLASDGPEVGDRVAVTIASWYQSPGRAGHVLAALASGAPVEYDDLARDIHLTRALGLSRDDEAALDVLSTWALDRTNANRRDYASPERASTYVDPVDGEVTEIPILTWDEINELAREAAADDDAR